MARSHSIVSSRWGRRTGTTGSGTSATAGSAWTHVIFELSEPTMTRVQGAGAFADSLGDVVELRILSSASAAWRGDMMTATIHLDNIFASTVPVELQSFSVE